MARMAKTDHEDNGYFSEVLKAGTRDRRRREWDKTHPLMPPKEAPQPRTSFGPVASPFITKDRIRFYEQYPVIKSEEPLRQPQSARRPARPRAVRKGPPPGSQTARHMRQARASVPQTARRARNNVGPSAYSDMPAPNGPGAPRPAFSNTSTRMPGQFGSYLAKEEPSARPRHPSSGRGLMLSAERPSQGGHAALPTQIRSRGNESVTMSEHSALVGEAIDHKAEELHAVFWAKLQAETQKTRADASGKANRERQALQQVINNYQMKFEEIDHYFDEIKEAKRYIDALAKENAILRKLTMKATKIFQDKISQRQQQNVLVTKSVNSSSFEPDKDKLGKQLQLLQEHAKAKDDEVAFLEEELARYQREAAEFRARMEERVLAEAARAEAAAMRVQQALQTAKAHQIEQEENKSQVMDIQAKYKRKADLNRQVQNEIAETNAQIEGLELEKLAMHEKMEEAEYCYIDEVDKALVAHDVLVKEMTAKARPFYDHFKIVEGDFTICAQIHEVLKIDIVCRQCLDVLKEPTLLWPCGHTLCDKCQDVQRQCRECVGQKEAADLEKSEELQFDNEGHDKDTKNDYTNPLTGDNKAPETFKGQFYREPNALMDLIMAAYNTALANLKDTILNFNQASHSFLTVSRFEVFKRITGLGQQEYEQMFQAPQLKGTKGGQKRDRMNAQAREREKETQKRATYEAITSGAFGDTRDSETTDVESNAGNITKFSD